MAIGRWILRRSLAAAWIVPAASLPAFPLTPLASVARDLARGVYRSEQHRGAEAGLRELGERITRVDSVVPVETRRRLGVAVGRVSRRESSFWASLPEAVRLGRGNAGGREAESLAAGLRELEGLFSAIPAPPPQPPPSGEAFVPALFPAARLEGAEALAARAAAAKDARAAAFWDGGVLRRGDPSGPAAVPVSARAVPETASSRSPVVSPPSAKVPVRSTPGGPAAPPAPQTAAAPSLAASCRQALAAYPTASGLCENHPALAPIVAGVLDALRQQFGTAQGLLTNLAWMLISVVMSVVSGFGVAAKIIVGLASFGLTAGMLWPLLRQGWEAGRDLRRATAGTEEYFSALFRLGLVGGTALILALLAAAGWGLGKSEASRRVFSSLDRTLAAKVADLGLPAAAAAERTWTPGTVASLLSNIVTPEGKGARRVAAALGRGAQEAAEFGGGRRLSEQPRDPRSEQPGR